MRKLIFSVSIHDCRIDTFTVGGHGGGGKDTSNSGVRVTHEPSGAVGKCGENRSNHLNKRIAFRRMTETKAFKAWHRTTTSRLLGEKSIDERVEEDMHPRNLRVETRNDEGRWTICSEIIEM